MSTDPALSTSALQGEELKVLLRETILKEESDWSVSKEQPMAKCAQGYAGVLAAPVGPAVVVDFVLLAGWPSCLGATWSAMWWGRGASAAGGQFADIAQLHMPWDMGRLCRY